MPTLRLLWEAIKTVPVDQQARALSELPLWRSDRPKDWLGWGRFKREFDEPCSRLTDADKPVRSGPE